MTLRCPLLWIAAGGTGGHMYPAQALAEEMLRRGWRVTLSTDARGDRYSGGFPPAVERAVVKSATFAQGSWLTRLTSPFTISAGVMASLAAMRRDPPACVAGFGGYPALPAMSAATILRIPRLIHEQNGVLGRVNRVFAKVVDAVACGVWPTVLPKGVDGIPVGNPVRDAIWDVADAPYHLSRDGPIHLLVIGGSQGAGLFSSVVPAALGRLPYDLRDRIVLSQQVRPEGLREVTALYEELEINAELRPFFDDVPQRLAQAALVISRAGAGSIAEITATGRPSILIPYAAAMDDHQSANAAALVAAGGAFAIAEYQLTPYVLAGHLTEILSDPEGAAAMAYVAKQQARPNATTDLADLVENLTKQEPQQ